MPMRRIQIGVGMGVGGDCALSVAYAGRSPSRVSSLRKLAGVQKVKMVAISAAAAATTSSDWIMLSSGLAWRALARRSR